MSNLNHAPNYPQKAKRPNLSVRSHLNRSNLIWDLCDFVRGLPNHNSRKSGETRS
jgi:hypothetical protein